MRLLLFLLVCVLSSLGCSKKILYTPLSSARSIEKAAVTKDAKRQFCNCNVPENYIPDGRMPLFEDMKYIRLNFHYPNSTDKRYNFTGDVAVQYSKALVNNANSRLKDNVKMRLPLGNTTPVIHPNYQYVLSKDNETKSGLAVYDALDDEHWHYIKKGRHKNNYDRTLIRKFAVNDDTILNVFAMGYHPDSLDVPGFSSGRAGIALGTSVKVAGIIANGPDKAWKMTTLMNHEIGHVLGLNHSWYKNDGCEDTPPNPNCWGRTGSGNCSENENLSNNVMDYNNAQNALTPCQIGRTHMNMSKKGHKARELVIKTWCDYDPSKNLIVSDSLLLNRAVDMRGDIVVLDGGVLRLSCRTHMPKGGKIIIHPEGTLILNGVRIHNDCGEEWAGIEVQQKGDKKGTIQYFGNVKLENLFDED